MKRKIIISVIRVFSIQWGDIINLSRETKNVDARKALCYMLRKYTDMDLQAIGDIFGHSHATVIHAVKQANNFMETDRKFRSKMNQLEILITRPEPIIKRRVLEVA